MNDPEQEEEKAAGPASGWEGVWVTREGRILAVGVALAVTGSLAVLLLPFWAPDHSQEIMAMSAAHLVFGRAAAMSIGYSQNLAHGVVIGVNLFIEATLVLIFYPLFVLGCHRLPLARPLDRMLSRARTAAQTHHASIRRFGAAGLALFVWLPFWMTGPVVGSFIGYLIGLPVWLNLGVVLVATSVAIVGWAFFLFQLTELVSRWGTLGPVLFVAALLIAIVVARLLYRSPPDEDPSA